MFMGFIEGITYANIKKFGKKRFLESSWEGPFCLWNIDGNGSLNEDERGRICVIKGNDE